MGEFGGACVLIPLEPRGDSTHGAHILVRPLSRSGLARALVGVCTGRIIGVLSRSRGFSGRGLKPEDRVELPEVHAVLVGRARGHLASPRDATRSRCQAGGAATCAEAGPLVSARGSRVAAHSWAQQASERLIRVAEARTSTLRRASTQRCGAHLRPSLGGRERGLPSTHTFFARRIARRALVVSPVAGRTCAPEDTFVSLGGVARVARGMGRLGTHTHTHTATLAQTPLIACAW